MTTPTPAPAITCNGMNPDPPISLGPWGISFAIFWLHVAILDQCFENTWQVVPKDILFHQYQIYNRKGKEKESLPT